MRRTSFGLQALTLVLGCLVLSGSAPAQAPSAIQIFMPNGGMPSRAIALVIDRSDGTRDLVYTDSGGKYRVPTPRNQSVNYTVTIAGDTQTFATTVASFTIERSSPNQMNVFLNPIAAEKRPADAVVDVATCTWDWPFMQLQQPEKAEHELVRAYELAGNSVGAAQLMLGFIYYKQHRFAEAEQAFEQYLKDVPYATDAREINQLIAETQDEKDLAIAHSVAAGGSRSLCLRYLRLRPSQKVLRDTQTRPFRSRRLHTLRPCLRSR